MFPEVICDDVFHLETKRVWLRWPRHKDAQIITQLAGDEAISEMTAKIPNSFSKDAAEVFIFETRRANANGLSLTLVACPREKPDQVIGLVSIFKDNVGEMPQIGFWLDKKLWGQGYMTEIINAMLHLFFNMTDCDELCASVRLLNPASQRVLEKCHFEFEGNGVYEAAVNGQILDVKHYHLTREKWLSTKSIGFFFQTNVRKATPVILQ
jgi:Acetyltransferases, including N-acetylases of ribosomal proteins